MTTPSRPAANAGATTNRPDDIRRVVDTLVAHAVLTPGQVPAAVEALTGSRVTQAEPPARRGRAAEIAGYAGAALVVSAAGLFLTTSWWALTKPDRVGLLAGAALFLAVAGAALARGTWGAAARRDVDPPRRRLVSTLWVGAAWAAGGAAYVAAAPSGDDGGSNTAWLVSGAVTLAAAGAAYALVPSLVGQLAVWGALWWVVESIADLTDTQSTNPYGVALVIAGVGWALLGVRNVLRERETALALGILMAFVGAQSPLLDGTPALAYALTGALAAACFAAHLRLRAWPLLAGGVAATTFVVPEAIRAATDDALPVTGVLLVAGLTLLAACALGLRLHADPGVRRSSTD